MSNRPILSPSPEIASHADRYYRQIAGALIGGAAADALGWITEFVRGKEHLRTLYKTDFVTNYRPWQKVTGGRFNAYIDHINRGEYSDDTQLTLAVARSILADGSVDIDHFAKLELPLWLDYARGGGRTITAAARAIQRKSVSWSTNFFTVRTAHGEQDYRQAGANGAAMRVAPLALANPNWSERMAEGVWRTAIVTHGHPRAIISALAYAEGVRQALQSQTKSQSVIGMLSNVAEFVADATVPDEEPYRAWLSLWNERSIRPFEHVWRDAKTEMVQGLERIGQAEAELPIPELLQSLGCFDPATRGSGTATVLAGFGIFTAIPNDFRKAVETAINQLGSDTDTIGAFVGGLAGAWSGLDAIPADWAAQLQDYDYFMRLATELAAVAVGEGMGNLALIPQRRPGSREGDLLAQLREKSVNAKDHVYHPLFGRGVVESVEAQSLRRRDGARAVFARVLFHMGQSCKFRYLEFPTRHKGMVERKRARSPDNQGDLFADTP